MVSVDDSWISWLQCVHITFLDSLSIFSHAHDFEVFFFRNCVFFVIENRVFDFRPELSTNCLNEIFMFSLMRLLHFSKLANFEDPKTCVQFTT